MWPPSLDMSKEESIQNLRSLELKAYAHLVSALRAQGPLNSDKRKLLRDTSIALSISQERHKAEIRRALNDERLTTIAYHVTGLLDTDDWALEGRRIIPLIPRTAPQTAYSAIADEMVESAYDANKSPNIDRKRLQPVQFSLGESSRSVPFRIPDTPKLEDGKKRKMSPICTESSTLAQHLLGPPKMCRIQHIYKQRSKMGKELNYKSKKEIDLLHPRNLHHPIRPKNATYQPLLHHNGPKFHTNVDETIEQIQNEINGHQRLPTTAVVETPASNRPPTPKKPALPKGQKLIVVSNAQTLTTSGVVQKTLAVPFVKNIPLKSLEKFKIVTTATTSNLQVTGATTTTPMRHKLVTVKTNPTKKVLHLSQLIGSKGGIKVLPFSGKVVGKATTTPSSAPLLISVAKSTPLVNAVTLDETWNNTCKESPKLENGKVIENDGDNCAEQDDGAVHEETGEMQSDECTSGNKEDCSEINSSIDSNIQTQNEQISDDAVTHIEIGMNDAVS